MSFERALLLLLFLRSYVPFDARITLIRINSPASDRGQNILRDSFSRRPSPLRCCAKKNIVSSADRRRAVSRSSAFVRPALVRYSVCAPHPPTLTKLAGAFRRPAAARMPARRARAGHQTGSRVARSLTKPRTVGARVGETVGRGGETKHRSCEAWSRDVSVYARGGGRASGRAAWGEAGGTRRRRIAPRRSSAASAPGLSARACAPRTPHITRQPPPHASPRAARASTSSTSAETSAASAPRRPAAPRVSALTPAAGPSRARA